MVCVRGGPYSNICRGADQINKWNTSKKFDTVLAWYRMSLCMLASELPSAFWRASALKARVLRKIMVWMALLT